MMMVRAHLVFFNFFINGGSVLLIFPYSGSVQEFVDFIRCHNLWVTVVQYTL